jgi:hypothetical protein
MLALFCGACAKDHGGPEGADTVTNWLASCSQGADCSGEAVCLNSLCSLPCSMSQACSALHADAICDREVGQSACDLPCETTGQCLGLGVGYTCQAQRCREAENESAPRGEDQPADASSSIFPLAIASEPTREAKWTDQVAGEVRRSSFAGGTDFELSGSASADAYPNVTWQADRWRVTWDLERFAPTTRIDVATVFPEGSIETRQITIDVPSERVFQGEGDNVVHLREDEPGRCALRASNLATAVCTEPWRFDCILDLAPEVARVPGSEDWLVSWSAASVSQPEQKGLFVARYRPGLLGWVAGPWQIASYGNGDGLTTAGPLNTTIAAAGGDLWVSELGSEPRGVPSSLYRIVGLAQPLAPTRVPALVTLQRFSYDFGERRVLPIRDGGVAVVEDAISWTAQSPVAGIRTTVIGAEPRCSVACTGVSSSSSHEPADLVLADSPSFVVTQVAEHALLALCLHSDEGGLSLLMLDEQGAPVSERVVVVESSDPAGLDGRYASRCSLAWSGSEFLVAWHETSFKRGPLVTQPATYSLRAQIVPLPALKTQAP